MPKTCAIVPAAGRGLRMGAMKPKQFLELSGKPILLHTLESLSRAGFLSEVLVVIPDDFMTAAENLLRHYCYQHSDIFEYQSRSASPDDGPSDSEEAYPVGSSTDPRGKGKPNRIILIGGGAERQDSVFNGLRKLPPDCDWVLIHDGVRPFVSRDLLRNTWEAAQKVGAAIAALPASDTIKRARAGEVLETLQREEIWLIQTPQVFRRDVIVRAYQEARRQGCSGTDDAYFVERLGLPVAVVSGERSNIKVTTREDLAWGSWFLTRSRSSCEPGVQ
jgi:2-C-methyl-D-erythritol 4-phosphate cytidylyltransferase